MGVDSKDHAGGIDMKKKHTIKAPTLLEMLGHIPSEIAKSAFKTGNASGVHGKKKSKQDRIIARQEERNAQRGENPEERGHSTVFAPLASAC